MRGSSLTALSLAVGDLLLVAATLARRDWVEAILPVDPDAGGGSLEWLVVAAVALAAVALGPCRRRLVCGRDWSALSHRRRRLESGARSA